MWTARSTPGTRIDDVVHLGGSALWMKMDARTDALMVATMDTNAKTVNIMNIPRDTMQQLRRAAQAADHHAAYAMGGIEQTAGEIERLMGFQPDKYVIVNLTVLRQSWMRSAVDYEIPFPHGV